MKNNKLAEHGELAAAMSERLSKLALPNSHLVEAVLKEHYHIFNDECRDRLKRLLQIILTANHSDTGPNAMNEIFRRKYIRNLRRRIQCLEDAERRKEGYSTNLDKITKLEKMEANEKLEKIEILERYEGLSHHDKLNKIEKIRVGDQGDQKLTQICKKDGVHIIFKSPQSDKDLEIIGQAGDCIGNISNLIKTDSSTSTALVRIKNKNYKNRDFKPQWAIDTKKCNDTPPVLQQDHEDYYKTPVIAVHYYMVLMNDMKRNCELYQEFIKQLLRPTESYKKPYINAAYRCWLDYLEYIKNTLNYLHPYIMNQMRDNHLTKSKESERRLPKVLINSMKNMPFWRTALADTVDCCKTLLEEPPNDDSVAVNIRELYVRYYKRIYTLVKSSKEVKLETQNAKL